MEQDDDISSARPTVDSRAVQGHAENLLLVALPEGVPREGSGAEEVVSHRTGSIVVICPEDDGICELCGAFEETRPYGEGGKRICFECGMKDEVGTGKRMGQVLFGEKEPS